MSSRSKKLLSLVLRETNKLEENDDNNPIRCLDVQGSHTNVGRTEQTIEANYDSRSRSSDLNESRIQVAKEMEIIRNHVMTMFSSDDSIPESIQASPQRKKVPRCVSETESELFGGDFSDDDPSYKPVERPRDSDSDESLITLEDLLGSSNKTNPGFSNLEPQPGLSRQPAEINPISISDFVSAIITDILDLVWGRVKPMSRWRTANPNNWKNNIAKKRRAEGLPYVTNKKVRAAKVPKLIDCASCMFKCTDTFSQQDREKICRMYWDLNFVGKKNFILSHVTIHPPIRVVVNRKRSRPYNTKCFFDASINKKQVCQKFFTLTLNISASVIQDAIKHRDSFGFYSNNHDPRGLSEPPNKTSAERVKEVVDHINSFPTMEGHYVRKQSKRKYLDGSLTIPKMHALYLEKYKENPVSEMTYRRIFCTDFNLSFFVPKKDQCQTCNKYHAAKGDTKIELEISFQEHIGRKAACSNEKEKDKKRAEAEKNFISVTFDLQAILQIPCSKIGILYFVRKLTLYNLCIYESALPNNAFCFTWSEVHGKKGSAEIGTILLHYLEKCVPSNVTEVSLFSDTCSGQNRNQYVAAILLWAVNRIINLQVIEQKFLESGHSYMEADSMHSSIENEKKHTDVFSITDWTNIFKRARSKGSYIVGKKRVKKTPYHVKEFKYNEFFFDLKNLAEAMIKNKSKNSEGNKVNWLKIKRIKYVKDDTRIFYNYDMSEDFLSFETRPVQRMPITPQFGPRTRKGSRKSNPNCVEPPKLEEGFILPELKQLYDHALPISAAKKKDLMTLCEKGVIPEEYHGWFRSLNGDPNIVDRVPDVAADESSSEEE